MRTRTTLARGAALGLLALGLGACGGNDEPKPPPANSGERDPAPVPVTPSVTPATPDDDAADVARDPERSDPGEVSMGATIGQPGSPPANPDRPVGFRPPPPLRPAAPAVPPADPAIASFGGLSGPKPVTWAWQPPARQFSIAEYVVPGASGEDQAHITVTRVGGTFDDNVARWKGQFRDRAGDPVDPILHELKGGAVPATVVELAGDYLAMGGAPEPDQLFLTAVLEPDTGSAPKVFIKFVGPRVTVEANRDAFMEMVSNLKYVEPEK